MERPRSESMGRATDGATEAVMVDSLAPSIDCRNSIDTGSVDSGAALSLDLSISTEDEYDNDPSVAVGLSSVSYTSSLTSSMYDFPEEFGRRWHKYKEGKYWMPNDEQEQIRLDIQHAISLKLFGALHLAPIANPMRVLDIGTGTGIWALEFAEMHPEAEVIGTDLSPIFPDYSPPNCRFEIDDAEDEWAFSRPFDYVHMRYMSVTVRDFPKLIGNVFAGLAPGGFLELQDYRGRITSIDGTDAGSHIAHWVQLLTEGVRQLGIDVRQADHYRRWMTEAGFVDVQERHFALPQNPWARGQDKKELGYMQMVNISSALAGMSYKVLSTQLGMRVEDEIEPLLEAARRDLQDRSLHCYYPMVVVYGRKPL